MSLVVLVAAWLTLSDSMIAVAMLALNLFHPGMCFNDRRKMAGRTTAELNAEYNDGMAEMKK